MGDLFVTCSSPPSRNYRVGLALGRGQPLDVILADMDQVAEGINTLGLLKAEADRRQCAYAPGKRPVCDISMSIGRWPMYSTT